MVGDQNESMMIVSMWASITTRFTPPFLFCVTNLIIAILFMANSKSNTKTTTTTYHEEQEHHQHDHEDVPEREQHVRGTTVLLKPVVAQVTLLLERAKSIDLKSITIPIIPINLSSLPKLPKYTSSSRLAQSIFSACSYDSQPDSPRYPSKKLPKPSPAPISGRLNSTDFSSIYDDNVLISTELQHNISNSPVDARVNSTKIRTPRKSETPSSSVIENFDLDDHRVIRRNSEKTRKKKNMVEIIKTSRSEVRKLVWDDDRVEIMKRPETARARQNAADDAKANDFITKFRGQLKLQRLDSLNRYNDMLRRPID